MTKAELVKALEAVPDDEEIYLFPSYGFRVEATVEVSQVRVKRFDLKVNVDRVSEDQTMLVWVLT